MPLQVALVGANGPYAAEFDKHGYIVVMGIEHHKIHEGFHYTCQDYDNDVDASGSKYWMFVTPSNTIRVHMNFTVRAGNSGLVEFFEGGTTSANGTSLAIFNNDRNSSNTCGCNIYRDPTVTVDGTRIPVNVIGSDGVGAVGGSGGVVDRTDELILKPDIKYLVKFTPVDDNTRVSCCFKWYEV